MNLLSAAKEDLDSQSGRIGPNLKFLQKLGKTYLNKGQVDDRQFLYEDVIRLAVSLPNNSGVRQDLSSQFIKTLWGKLEHPPLSYLGDEFKYRMADGSCNNIKYPQLGAAGSHYARSVNSQHTHTSTLPDPGLIFDTIMARRGPARPHPNGVSSSLFHFGTIIIHDIFRTDEHDSTRAKSSSYLDLGPLYGHNQGEQDKVRTFRDGMLKKDTFSEMRIIAQPPGVGALLVAFNRFHNWIAGELATINEKGKFSPPPRLPGGGEDIAAIMKRDNDLFQTARLITCGLYVNVILNDYLRAILNLNTNPFPSDWRLDPRDTTTSVFDPEGTPHGIGNQVSAEFNFVYRWHATVSNSDEAWLNDINRQIFEGVSHPESLDTKAYFVLLRKWFTEKVPPEPENRTFGGLKRGKNGSFNDADLVKIITQATDTVGGSFGARNTPKALKAIEVLGIQQGRDWGMATLNEFRQFFNLKQFTSFEEVNSKDPGVADALRALYGHPDNIELYPGLMAEEAKPVVSPGSGLCPGYTISEAILSDALTLVRGDRFYAHEYGPQSLTSFGFKAASSDFDVASGGVMHKLLMRAFPGWHRNNSVYALYPFSIPSKTKEIFSSGGAKPPQPISYDPLSLVGPPIPVTSWQGSIQVLHDQEKFKVPWGLHISQLTGHDFMLGGDKPSNTAQREFFKERMFRPEDTLAEVRDFYEKTTAKLIRKNGLKLGGSSQIDIVQDIGIQAHAEFAGRFFGIPMRPEGSEPTVHPSLPHAYTPSELYEVLAKLFQYVFLDLDSAKSYKNLVVAGRETVQLGETVRRVVQGIKGGEGLLVQLFGMVLGKNGSGDVHSLEHFGRDLIRRLMEQGHGRDINEVVWALVPTVAAACVPQVQGWAQLIDVYLSDDYKKHWKDIVRLSQSDDPKAFEQLKQYALEGFRLFPPASGVIRVVASQAPVTVASAPKPLSPGSGVFVDFMTAGRDPSKFPNPDSIKLDRPYNAYLHQGFGPHSCLGRPIVEVAAAAMLRQFARNCPNVKESPGDAGKMKTKLFNGAFPVFLSQNGDDWEAFPVAKKVIYDGFAGMPTGGAGPRKNGFANGYN
ncbi:hypothetical protein PFICI_04014 [Pestalotiopsis fici W106-1]|uniref:Linoleate 8R-lipoxygenase n=1 Tax=Pestalotiopsis fici (strain W106-1 / CGMCC3.15140) TaxID=1229662 RepID=W3XIZ7_PESFW|nr:uncharacterized protein PFICI_04014 [Pestalotiopsis fici W106-1]ETS85989.1 hypothetical protein PFICI_04014 [Pestalotiopsis fici W106-1]